MNQMLVNKMRIFLVVLTFFLVGCSSQIEASSTAFDRTMIPTETIRPTSTAFLTLTPTATVSPTLSKPIPTAIKPTNTNTPTPLNILSYRSAIPDGDYFLVNKSSEFLDMWVSNPLMDIPLFVVKTANYVDVPYVSLSPDGKYVAYVQNVSQMDVQIMLLNLLDNQVKKVGAQDCAHPTFAPDSQSLAMICTPDQYGPGAVYSIEVVDLFTGSKAIVFQTDKEEIYNISWSPDGEKIAYQLYGYPPNNAYDKLFILELQCSPTLICQGQSRFVSSTPHVHYPILLNWSPDGRYILLSYDNRHLVAINATDGGLKSIIELDHNQAILGYAWAPDGLSIGFTQDWLLNAENKNKIQIIQFQGEERKSISITDKGEGIVLFNWIKQLNFKIGNKYLVSGAAQDLAIRMKPSNTGMRLKSLQPSDSVTIIDGPVNSDFCSWWKVKVGDVEGWVQGIRYWFNIAK
jgi:hypothetical protein